MRTNHHPRWYLLPVLLAALMIASCRKGKDAGGDPAATHNLTLKFKAMAGTEPMELGKTYTNAWGEQYTVSAFKFYITQIRLVNTTSGLSQNVNKDEYFLVNFADSASVALNLKAVPNSYNGIAFLLGVDSIRNVSGAQTGALDPAKGMFWTWSTGYIMAKLEGSSPVSNQPNNRFEYHIGGFSGANNVLKQVPLIFPYEATLKEGKSSQVVITANVNSWFAGPNALKISTTPVSMTPGPLSKQFADNYATMFTVAGILNQ
jgi:hypothetical protein